MDPMKASSDIGQEKKIHVLLNIHCCKYICNYVNYVNCKCKLQNIHCYVNFNAI